MADRGPPPDGYEWTGRQTEIRLIDPTWCPTGHPIESFRRGYTHCSQHHGHTYWTCECGQDIYRAPGQFTGETLECITATEDGR